MPVEDPALANPFWTFSLAVYAEPGVQAECLDLQDQDGIDVNMLLFCAWLGACRHVLLTAADLERAAERVTRGFRRVARDIHNVFNEIEGMEVPVIAAINGVAAGGGMELALSCDFRIAADTAKLGFPENNVGLIPGSGGCSRLVKLVGLARAKRLVMSGEMVTAERGLALGLVEEVVPAAGLREHALAFAKTLEVKAPLALGLAKIVLNACANVDPDTGRHFERIGQSVLKTTEDHLEGARAFVEKRKPAFKGR